MNIALWIVQILLALLFLFGGVVKLVTPMDQMASILGISVGLLKFVGVVETLGGIGLILPALLRIKPVLTPIAALGLFIVMIGAVYFSLKIGPASGAILPFITGLLLLFVAYGRFSQAPIRLR